MATLMQPKITKLSRKLRMWFIFIVIILVVLSFRNELVAQNWDELRQGLVKRKFVVQVLDDRIPIEVNVIRIDPRIISEVKVINVLGSLSNLQSKKFLVYSLREVISQFKPQVIINGGFAASYSLPIASGLLMENRKNIVRLNMISRTQTGIFCVNDREFKILRREEYKKEDWVHAFQAGPIIVELPGNVGIYQSEKQKKEKYRRSVVAIDRQGRLLFINSSESHLYALAKFLVKEESEGGLDCIVALNLSGDEESGLYVRNNDLTYIFGNIDVPISSAIAIFLQ